MLKVYVASKLTHAQMFKDLRLDWFRNRIHINSTWLDAAHLEMTNPNLTAQEYAAWWVVDFHDIDQADVLLIYGEAKDDLRGALVETGYAIAKGKTILMVGASPSFGTWQYRPGNVRCASLKDAHEFLLTLRHSNWE